jgi:hypothetical protein
MLDSRAGSLRPWELELLTPAEEAVLHRYKEVLDQQEG